MRRSCLFILFISAFPYFGLAQFGDESPIPYFRYSVSTGLGPTLMYGDLEKRQIGGAVYLRGNYFLAHGISLGLELQEGLLRGEDRETTSLYGNEYLRRATNLYHAAILGVNFQPIKFLQDDHLRRIEYRESFGKRALNSVYIGVGVGALYSLQWDGQRTEKPEGPDNDNTNNTISQEELILQGSRQGVSYLVNTNIGIEIPLHSLKPDLLDSYIWNLVVNGQLNFSLDDELDGYSGAYTGNVHRDVYGLFTVGVNLRF